MPLKILNWNLHSRWNGTTTLCGLVKVGCDYLYWNTSVLCGQTAVHSCVWKSWEWEDDISYAFHRKPLHSICIWPWERTKLGLLLSISGLTGTCSHSYYIPKKSKSAQKKPRMALSLFINPELQPEFRRSFSLKCCRMLLRSCKMCSVKLVF